MMNGETDEVFCDPNDTWEKDDRVVNSPSISPFLYVFLLYVYS